MSLDINWKREFKIHATKWEAIKCIWNTLKNDLLLTLEGLRK